MLPTLTFQKRDPAWLAKKMQKRGVPKKNTPGRCLAADFEKQVETSPSDSTTQEQ